MNSVQKETIKLYAKQLRVPTFNNYEKVIRQLSPDDGCICRSQNRSCTDLKPHFNGYKTAPLPLVNRTKE